MSRSCGSPRQGAAEVGPAPVVGGARADFPWPGRGLFDAGDRGPVGSGAFDGVPSQYLPKRKSMVSFTQADLDAIADRLNGRPRQTLSWMTPSQKLEVALR
jgi:hypothetical protein